MGVSPLGCLPARCTWYLVLHLQIAQELDAAERRLYEEAGVGGADMRADMGFGNVAADGMFSIQAGGGGGGVAAAGSGCCCGRRVAGPLLGGRASGCN